MTVKQFLESGDKRKRTYKDVKDYVKIIRHYYGNIETEKVMKKQVVDIVGVVI